VFNKLKVLPKDLQLCTDMATGVDSLGQFSFGDLVQLESVHFFVYSSQTLYVAFSSWHYLLILIIISSTGCMYIMDSCVIFLSATRNASMRFVEKHDFLYTTCIGCRH